MKKNELLLAFFLIFLSFHIACKSDVEKIKENKAAQIAELERKKELIIQTQEANKEILANKIRLEEDVRAEKLRAYTEEMKRVGNRIKADDDLTEATLQKVAIDRWRIYKGAYPENDYGMLKKLSGLFYATCSNLVKDSIDISGKIEGIILKGKYVLSAEYEAPKGASGGERVGLMKAYISDLQNEIGLKKSLLSADMRYHEKRLNNESFVITTTANQQLILKELALATTILDSIDDVTIGGIAGQIKRVIGAGLVVENFRRYKMYYLISTQVNKSGGKSEKTKMMIKQIMYLDSICGNEEEVVLPVTQDVTGLMLQTARTEFQSAYSNYVDNLRIYDQSVKEAKKKPWGKAIGRVALTILILIGVNIFLLIFNDVQAKVFIPALPVRIISILVFIITLLANTL